MSEQEVEEFLEHYGVQGMRWGVRKSAPSGSDIKGARKELKEIRKSASSAIKAHRKATTPAQKKAAQANYKKEVVDRINKVKYKQTFIDANTYTKGEVVAGAILSGPAAPLTLIVGRATQDSIRRYGAARDAATSKQVYEEMKSS